MNTVQLLKEVKREVEGGWTKYVYKKGVPVFDNPRGYEVCLLGAIDEVCGKYRLPGGHLQIIETILPCIEDRGFYTIPTFNDYSSTNKQDVLDVIDCAIDKVK